MFNCKYHILTIVSPALHGRARQCVACERRGLSAERCAILEVAFGQEAGMRGVTTVTAAVATLIGLLPIAQAQRYPSKTIEIVVSYGAGGSTDLIARAIAQKL